MWTRFQIWRVRRRARIASRYSSQLIWAKYDRVVIVGKFRRGKEVGSDD